MSDFIAGLPVDRPSRPTRPDVPTVVDEPALVITYPTARFKFWHPSQTCRNKDALEFRDLPIDEAGAVEVPTICCATCGQSFYIQRA